MLHDILLDLLPKVDIKVRQELARQLSAMRKPPAELLSLLVHDVIEVSAPLLESAVVSDDDLREVIELGGPGHRQSIARRKDLSPAVKALLGPALLQDRLEAKTVVAAEVAPPTPAPAPTAPVLAYSADKAEENRPAPNVIQPAVRQPGPDRPVYRDVVRAVTDWTWETDRTGQIVYLSDSSVRAFGRPARSMRSFYLSDYCMLFGKHQSLQDLQQLLERRRPFRDLDIVTRDAIGQERKWLMSGVPRFDALSERFDGFRGTACEVTDIDLVEKVTPQHKEFDPLRHKGAPSPAAAPSGSIAVPPATQQMEKGSAELIQELSHELRTPLNAILGFSQMIDFETWGPVNPSYGDQVKVILQSAHYLKNIINDVLDIARLRAGKQHIIPKFSSMSAILAASIEAAQKSGIAQQAPLTAGHADQDIPILNDPEIIQRCLTKLLTWSAHRAYPGQSLVVKTARGANNKAEIDIPVLGPPLPLPNMASSDANAVLSDARTVLSDESASSTFALTFAADLAQTVGGELSLLMQDGVANRVRLTIGDYPADPADIAI